MARFAQSQVGAHRFAEDVRETAEEVLEVPPWESLTNYDDTPTIVVDGFDADGNAQDVQITLTPDRTNVWNLEIRNGARQRLATLTDFWGSFWEENASEGSSLQFSVTYDNTNRSKLVHGNQIWLRDRYGFVLDVFEISKILPEQDMDSRFLHVVAANRIAQLAREPVISYEVTADDGKTVLEVLKDLLEDQLQTPSVAIGTIDPQIADVEVNLVAQQTNVLAAIRLLQNQLSRDNRGVYYVGSDGAFHWRLRTGWQAGQVISVAGNLQGVSRSENWDDTYNRLYMYGEGEDPQTRLSLTDAGHGTVYLDGTTQGALGIIPRIKIDKRIRHPESLLAVANRLIEEHQNPYYTYAVRVIDLSKADTANIGTWVDLFLDSDVRMVAEDVDIDTTIRITKIRHDLAHPLNLEVELDNRTPTMGSLFAEIFDRLNAPFSVDDDGSLYPRLMRLLKGTEAGSSDFPRMAYRDGDMRFNDGPPARMQFWDDTAEEWKDVRRALGDDGDVQSVTDTNAAGNGDTGAPINHTHAMGAAAFGSDVQDIGTANAAGSGTDVALDNHVHDIAGGLSTEPTDIQDTGATAAAGDGNKGANAKHVHKTIILEYSGP